MEFNRVLVVTTKKLAEMFGVSQTKLHIHFMKNKEKFKEGLHYFVLSGTEINEFKKQYLTKELKHTSVLYLWTANGAYLFAQTLRGEYAWRGYCQCIYYYYGTEKEILTHLDAVNEKIDQLKEKTVNE